MKTRLLSLVLIFIAAFTLPCMGQQIILYDNHFESPNIPPVPNCGPDLDATDLNTLWSGTAGGTGGGGSFQQVNTVETILINGPNGQYIDTSGIGGDYCISMLSTAQDDRAAVTLNSQNLPFAIVSMDISAIDLNGCGGPFGIDTPVMDIKIYDSPGAVFSFAAPGTLLDHDTITGITPGATIYTFNWLAQTVSMDIAGSTDGNITVVFDLLQSGYAAIDNLLIQSSLTSINPGAVSYPVSLFPNPSAGIFHIDGIMNASGCVKVHDLAGKVLLEQKITSSMQIDMAALPPGIYWVEINHEDQSAIQKVIKN